MRRFLSMRHVLATVAVIRPSPRLFSAADMPVKSTGLQKRPSRGAGLQFGLACYVRR